MVAKSRSISQPLSIALAVIPIIVERFTKRIVETPKTAKRLTVAKKIHDTQMLLIATRESRRAPRRMLAREAHFVYQTLVLQVGVTQGAYAILPSGRYERCRRYYRLIDPMRQVCFDVLEENNMTPLERLTCRVTFRSGMIVVAATVLLALSSMSERIMALATLAATVVGVSSVPLAAAEDHDTAIRPFRINVPKADLADLRRRLAATRWPSKELVKDRSQGVQLATLKELARYWATEYDWRKAEANLNGPASPFSEVDRGGHFAAWEEPALFVSELRAAFKPLR